MDDSDSDAFTVDVDDLVASLNLLLDNLDIPLQLETPYDLTPGILLAILEGTLKSRLPIPNKLRESQSYQAKVEAIKIFLGVLGTDVLEMDLTNIDPQRLAEGYWDESVYIGSLLVTVAQQQGILAAEEIIDIDQSLSTSQIGSESSLCDTSAPLMPQGTALRTPIPAWRITGTAFAPKRYEAKVSARNTTNFSASSSTLSQRTPRPPERESTPPAVSPQWITHGSSQIAYRPTDTSETPQESADWSLCSCTGELDWTASTLHCVCNGNTTNTSSVGSPSIGEDPDNTIRYRNVRSQFSDYTSRYSGKPPRHVAAQTLRNRQPRLSDEFLQLRSKYKPE